MQSGEEYMALLSVRFFRQTQSLAHRMQSNRPPCGPVLLLLLGMLGPLAGCNGAGKSAPELHEAALPMVYMAPLYLAVDRGTFRNEGLNLDILQLASGQLGVPALISKDVQFADIGLLDVVKAQAQGKKPILIYNLVNRMTMDFVVRKDWAKSHGLDPAMPLQQRLANLKGMRIGITRPGSPGDLYTRYFAILGGLDPQHDIDLVSIGDPSLLLSALRAARIDGYMLSPPTPGIAVSQGFGEMLIKSSGGDVPQLADHVYVAIAVDSDWAKEHPDMVKRYCRALGGSVAYARSHRQEALNALRRHLPGANTDVLQASLDEVLQFMPTDGKFNKDEVNNTLQVLSRVAPLAAGASSAEGILWTNEYNTK
jgi:NitT/TauT family transport system substrate-binding protein